MTLETVQLGNYGFKIIVSVKKPDGTARDLTGATQLKVKVKSALATAGKMFTGVAENLAQGQISYTFAINDIDAEGVWKAQAYYELGAWKGHTQAEDAFYVDGNLA